MQKESLHLRAVEIQQILDQRGLSHKPILVIDDFASSNRRTIHDIREAFHAINTDIQLDVFAFMAPDEGNDVSSDVLVGSRDTREEERFPGFDYRNASYDDTKPENVTGVVKKYDPSNPYVQRSALSTPQERQEFRQELSRIGESFVQDLEQSETKQILEILTCYFVSRPS